MSAFSNRPFDILSMLLGGRLNAPPGRGQFFPSTQGEALTWSGVTFGDMYGFQESASPVLDLIGANNLAQGTAPTFGVATDFPGRLAMRTADGTAQLVQAATTAVYDDDGITSHALYGIIKFGAAPAANREVYGKIGTGYYYLSYRATTGYLLALANDGTTLASAQIDVSHASGWHPVLMVIDRATDELRLRTDLGSATASIAALGSLTNTGRFRVGAISSLSSAADYALLARASGANAEGLDDAAIIANTWVGP